MLIGSDLKPNWKQSEKYLSMGPRLWIRWVRLGSRAQDFQTYIFFMENVNVLAGYATFPQPVAAIKLHFGPSHPASFLMLFSLLFYTSTYGDIGYLPNALCFSYHTHIILGPTQWPIWADHAQSTLLIYTVSLGQLLKSPKACWPMIKGIGGFYGAHFKLQVHHDQMKRSPLGFHP